MDHPYSGGTNCMNFSLAKWGQVQRLRFVLLPFQPSDRIMYPRLVDHHQQIKLCIESLLVTWAYVLFLFAHKFNMIKDLKKINFLRIIYKLIILKGK